MHPCASKNATRGKFRRKSMPQLVSVAPDWLKQEIARLLIGLKGVLCTAISSLHVMFKNTFVNDLRLNKDSQTCYPLCHYLRWMPGGSVSARSPSPPLRIVRSTCSRTCKFFQTFS